MLGGVVGIDAPFGLDLGEAGRAVQENPVVTHLHYTHSHYVSALSVANQVKVYAPPAGPGQDVPGILAAIEKFRTERAVPKGQLIQALDVFLRGAPRQSR